MSIASEITRLQGVKADILQAIADKGVVVPAGSALGDCPNLIASISGGGGGGGTPYLKNIMPTTGIKVVDENGYIGGNFLVVYYPNYYNNFALVVPDADYSNFGLGSVTFVNNTTTIGGRTYRTVTLNGVTWLAENLDYKFSGLLIGPTMVQSVTAAWYYNNDEATYGIDGERNCGLLYTWDACKLLNDNRATLCPGWHVPTKDEWLALIDYVSPGSWEAGAKLKASNVSWATTWGGTDDYGFGALPAGMHMQNMFGAIGVNTFFWTITEYNNEQAIATVFTESATLEQFMGSKAMGISLRLVKD